MRGPQSALEHYHCCRCTAAVKDCTSTDGRLAPFESNGEGQRGYIEDLNDLVTLHIKRTADRLGKNSNTISALSNDLVDLLAMGMLTLNAKLVDLSDDRLLVRIVSLAMYEYG